MVSNQSMPIVPEQGSFAESFKAKTSSIFEKVRDSKETIFNVALYAGFGFLLGYLTKKFSSYLILFAIFVVILIALQQFEVVFVAINWTKVQTTLGMQPVSGEEIGIFSMIWEWMKANVLISVSFIIGFLLGLKFGA